jgi:GT2 family glycosyltransferase
MDLTVIIPTYNPHTGRLNRTLNALKAQTLNTDRWELIVVDNNSAVPVPETIAFGWHPKSRLIRESRQGLTYARLKGFEAALGNIIVLVDDDNVLAADYLEQLLRIFGEHPLIGAVGGKCIPQFESQEPVWLKEFYGNLALRDLGEHTLINSWNESYPEAAPLGAGMALRKKGLENYMTKILNRADPILDRTGTSLGSGGDNDMVLEVLKAGWQVGYFPELVLTHLIPEERTKPDYIARLLNQTNCSWIQLLESHGINPWKKIPQWSLPLRKLKAWFTYAAWKNTPAWIRWNGACGTFDGLSKIG